MVTGPGPGDGNRKGQPLVTMVTRTVPLPETLRTRPTKVGDSFKIASQDGVVLGKGLSW